MSTLPAILMLCSTYIISKQTGNGILMSPLHSNSTSRTKVSFTYILSIAAGRSDKGHRDTPTDNTVAN